MTITQQDDPSDLRMDWAPTYQFLNYVVSHPKRYMPTLWMHGVTLDHVIGTKEFDGMVDGFQIAGRHDVGDGNRDAITIWDNMRAIDGLNYPVEDYANGIFYQIPHPAIAVAQMMEDSNIHGDQSIPASQRFQKVENVWKKAQEYMQTRLGVTVEQNWLIEDYFAGTYGWATDTKMVNIGYELSIIGMSSVAEARKVLYSDSGRSTGYYYLYEAWKYRHRMAPGYPEGFGTQGAGRMPYEKIYMLERQYIQMADRKVVVYGHGTFEGLNMGVIEKGGVWQCLPWAANGGDIIRLTAVEGSYNMIRTQTIISLCIADGYIIWDVNGPVGTNEKSFDLGYYGGFEPWKTRWSVNGDMSAVQYNAGSPGHPISEPYTPSREGAGAHWPGNPEISNNASWAANYIYGQIWDRQNGSLRYPSFTFSINGGATQNGYYNGPNPTLGTLGAEVSRFGVANIGQNNIVHSWFNGKLPIVWEGRTQGNDNRRVYHVFNLNAGATGTTVYNLPDGITITHVGDSWGVYKVDL